jgi:hypothetical protein
MIEMMPNLLKKEKTFVSNTFDDSFDLMSAIPENLTHRGKIQKTASSKI